MWAWLCSKFVVVFIVHQVALNDVEVSINNIQKLASELQVRRTVCLSIMFRIVCRLKEQNWEQQHQIAPRES